MIRVLQVVNAADRGGSETLAMNIYRNIDRSKIQFDFTNHKGIPAAYDEEIETLGGRIHYLPKFKGFNYFQYVVAWRELFKEHPEYQIIHIHNYNIAGIVSKVAKEMGIPVRITHSHSTRLNMPLIKRIVFKCFYGSMMRNTSHFFSCGKNAANFLFGINHPYTLIPNAIDVEKFKYDDLKRIKIRNELFISDDNIVYGHVGSFRTPKNHIFLIDIFSEIVKRNNKARLILVGGGDLQDSIRTKVDKLGLKDKVIFAGLQNNVNDWLSAFDFFLMPSLWEGFPVSVVEAQCAGLPCVISDVIDKDADITGKVSFISLKQPDTIWADKILDIQSGNRMEMGRIVQDSSFNIDKLSGWISDFYLKNISVK